jgi:DNA-binding NarL/FixJ family response regulator
VILEAIPYPVNRLGVLLFVEVPHSAMWDFNGTAAGVSMALAKLFGGRVEPEFIKFPGRLRTLPDGTNFPVPLFSTCEAAQRHSLSILSRGDIPIRPPLRILIADDHAVVRFGLKTILSNQEGWQVIGEAKSGAEALALALQLQPDVVLLDINMPGMSGLDALKAIRERLPATRAVILTLDYSTELVREIKRFGGKGYVTKSDCDRDLVEAVAAVAEGRTYFTHAPVDTAPAIPAMTVPRAADVGSLTMREREAVRNIAQTIRKLL